MASGRLFQVRGLAMANDLSAKMKSAYAVGLRGASHALLADLIPGR